MTIDIYRSRKRLSEQDIAEAEEELGLSLPVQYRDFLSKHNGGHPEPNAFPIENNPSDDHGLVHYFLCVKENDVYNLVDWVKRFHDRIPSGFLPIAVDPGGNLICLSTIGKNAGKVYFWDHEEEAREGEVPGYDNVYFIANSFSEFLGSLTELAI